MKKQIITTAAALVVAFSSVGIPALHESKVEAATIIQNTYNNQAAVDAKADQLITYAKSLIGQATYSTTEYKRTYPYKFSCATYMNFIFEKNGVDLATYNENYMMQQGVYVPKDQLQKGDLVFFDSNRTDSEPADHVGMYIGDNKIIHMADSVQNIIISDLDSKAYYTDNYLTARRVLPSLLDANPATQGDKIVDTSYSLINQVKIGSTNDESTMTFTDPGFVNYAFKKNGIDLGTNIVKEQMKLGSAVTKDQLKKGDLVFFNNTVGSTTPGIVAIYAGDHRLIVPTSSGVVTRVMFVDWYTQHYLTARRVISDTATPVNPIVNVAESLIGKAKFGYTYDENNLTFTGAGFVYYVFKQNGIDLQTKLASRQAELGTYVAKDQLQPGDVIYFSLDGGGTKITDAGIYAGNNEVIHLTSKNGLGKESLSSTWAQQNYVKAKRMK
jgi:cell wall-associated NlpC family hydrolase